MVRRMPGRILALVVTLVLSVAIAAFTTHRVTPSNAAGHPVSGVATSLITPGPTAGPPLYLGAPAYQYPVGVPAITPTVLGGSALTSQTSQATITTNDALDFVQSHALFHSDNGTSVAIVQSTIMPASEASKLLNGESIGRPATALVCVVKVHGSFSGEGSVPYGAPPMHFSTGWAIFDANTGNYLLGGYTA